VRGGGAGRLGGASGMSSTRSQVPPRPEEGAGGSALLRDGLRVGVEEFGEEGEVGSWLPKDEDCCIGGVPSTRVVGVRLGW
jgi:hypothetical protein